MFLELIVILLPTLFGLSIEIVSKKVKELPYYRRGIIGFGILLSGLTWLQIYKAHREAAKEEQTAIEETSERVSSRVSESVSRSVTKSVSEQYTQTINGLQAQIATLQSQLAAQARSVEVIKGSNIVTGKQPIKVEVANPGLLAPGEEKLAVHVSAMPGTPNLQYGKNARQFILTTNKIMDGARLLVTCKGKINQGMAMLSGVGEMMGGGSLVDEHRFRSGIDSPNWSPDHPLVITLYYGDEDLGDCTFSLN